MRRRAVQLTTAVASALVAVVGAGAVAFGARPDFATLCAPVNYNWAGQATVDPGLSFHTGSLVPAEVGTQMSVKAFDVSTNDPAVGVLSLWIGDTPVSAGAAVLGGEIVVANRGVVDVVVTRVEISVDRCIQVESAAPVPPSAAAPVLGVPTNPVDLPATGRASSDLLGVGLASTLAGAALLGLRRRRVRPISG